MIEQTTLAKEARTWFRSLVAYLKPHASRTPARRQATGGVGGDMGSGGLLRGAGGAGQGGALINLNGALFFTADGNGLWKSDGPHASLVHPAPCPCAHISTN